MLNEARAKAGYISGLSIGVHFSFAPWWGKVLEITIPRRPDENTGYPLLISRHGREPRRLQGNSAERTRTAWACFRVSDLSFQEECSKAVGTSAPAAAAADDDG